MKKITEVIKRGLRKLAAVKNVLNILRYYILAVCDQNVTMLSKSQFPDQFDVFVSFWCKGEWKRLFFAQSIGLGWMKKMLWLIILCKRKVFQQSWCYIQYHQLQTIISRQKNKLSVENAWPTYNLTYHKSFCR